MLLRFLTSDKRLGYHVHLEETLLKTLQNASFTSQMYWGSPRTWTQRVFSKEDLLATKQHCLRFDKNFYVHAACLIHLGKTKSNQGPTLAYLNSCLRQLEDVPGSMIVHIGKGVESQISLINDLLHQVQIPEGSGRARHKLLLENAAGAGHEKGRNWEELYEIFRQADPRIGLCIDTQHSFGSGMVDFRNVSEVDKFFQICDNYFPGRLQCIHLNDSGVPFGSRVDRHGNTRLTEGFIWSQQAGGDQALKHLLQEGYRRELDFILETGDGPGDLELLQRKYYF